MAALNKIQLRRELYRARASLPDAQAFRCSERAAQHIWRLPAIRRAHRVAAYLEAGSEMATAALLRQLWGNGMEVCVPRIHGSQMQFVVITPATPLRRNRHGIPEPVGRWRRPLNRLDAMFLPLVGFDAQGYRLGSGGGYYDRALAPCASRRRPLRIGYAFSMQQIPQLPREPWDIPLHAVVTELGVTQWRTG